MNSRDNQPPGANSFDILLEVRVYVNEDLDLCLEIHMATKNQPRLPRYFARNHGEVYAASQCPRTEY